MKLRDLNFKEDYRSGQSDVLEEFFRPVLRVATYYWRAVGYFSSTAFESFGSALATFIGRGGAIRLITSVELSDSDISAIEHGYSRRQVVEDRLVSIVETQFSNEIKDGAAALIALIETHRLDIRIAMPRSGYGIYHEKLGIFFDADDDFVSFAGSTNESQQALEQNYECLDVYCSWRDYSRALRKRNYFERLWENADEGAAVFDFPEAAKKGLLRAYEKWKDKYLIKEPSPDAAPSWKHQDRAVEIFLAEKRGVLNMATGTGKTRTALKIIRRLAEQGRDKLQAVFVAADGNDLLEQWYRQLLGLSDIFRIYRQYERHKENDEFLLDGGKKILVCSRLMLDRALKRTSEDVLERALLIHDEVHALGSMGNRTRLAGLSDAVRYRLGLSATPERDYDEEGNHFILEQIGPVIFEFGLKEAIHAGILAPFNYYPLDYVPSDEDRERISSVYKRQAAREAQGEPMSEEELWIELAKVYKTSRAKLPVFRDFIRQRPEILTRSIIFVETQEYSEEVLEIVHEALPDFHTYFSGEDAETLKRFARGELECLVTCHRLSEGIDIQSLNSVILFSSAKARLETIQRIGRCLRRNPLEPNKVAAVVDFIRVEVGEGRTNSDIERRDWLRRISETR